MRSNILLSSILLSSLIVIASIVMTGNTRYFLPLNVEYHTLSKPVQKQVDCLAKNIYFEAASEPRDGKVAVAMVTLNRLATGNYANDICGVVNQKTNGTCQFSWVCLSPQSLTIRDNMLYNDIRNLAVTILFNYESIKDVTYGATFYHADYVNPNWGLPKTTKIGRHIFYKSTKDADKSKGISI